MTYRANRFGDETSGIVLFGNYLFQGPRETNFFEIFRQYLKYALKFLD